jgi:hypothetical protein
MIMALQVNKEVTTKEGFIVPSGSYIRTTLKLPYSSFDIHADLNWYKDIEEYEAGGSSFVVTNINSMSVVKELTEIEFAEALGVIEPNNSLIIFNDFIIERIVDSSNGYFTIDDFEIVN